VPHAEFVSRSTESRRTADVVIDFLPDGRSEFGRTWSRSVQKAASTRVLLRLHRDEIEVLAVALDTAVTGGDGELYFPTQGWSPGITVQFGDVEPGMTQVSEFRVALTVPDFDEAVAFYRDAPRTRTGGPTGVKTTAGSCSLSSGAGRRSSSSISRPEKIDAIEAGRRVSGNVRLALEVADRGDREASCLQPARRKLHRRPSRPWGDRKRTCARRRMECS